LGGYSSYKSFFNLIEEENNKINNNETFLNSYNEVSFDTAYSAMQNIINIELTY